MKLALFFVITFAFTLHGQNRVLRDLSCTAATASGTAYACSWPVDVIGGYLTKERYAFKADVANTGAATINFSSHGAKTLKKVQAGALVDLVANDIGPGWVTVIYDGTYMQVTSQLGNGGGGSGATAVSQLLDGADTRTSNTVITVTYPTGGSNYSNGSYVQMFSPGTQTATLTSSSCAAGGVVYKSWNPATGKIQLDTNANVTQGNVSLAGSNFVFGGAAATTFPLDVKPLSTWTCGNTALNQWDASPISDNRSAFSTQVVLPGTNMTRSVDSHGVVTFNSTAGVANFPDLAPSAGTLVWGAVACTALNPCVLGPSDNPVSFTGSLGTITSATGTGTLYVYVASDGTPSVGYSGTGITAVACTTCLPVTGIAQFPRGSIANYTVPVSANVLGVPSKSLQAGAYGFEVVNAGAGLGSTISGNSNTLSVLPMPTSIGTSVTLSGNNQIFACTGACAISVPVPVAGATYCVFNDNNVSSVITLSAIGSSASYQNTAGTAYGTPGTGTMVSSGALKDSICIIGRDSTHYWTTTFNGSWTAN